MLLSKILISLFFVGICCFSNGNAASAELTAEEQAKLDQTLQKIESASGEQMENVLKALAAGGSDALKQAVNGIIKAQNGRYEFFKKVVDEASAHLSPKASQKLQNEKHLVMDRKLSQEEFDKKLAAIETNPDVEKELKSVQLMDERILDLENFGNDFLELDKNNDGFVSLEELNIEQAKEADTNRDGKLSPYEYALMTELTAKEKEILAKTATQSRNESVEQRANALIKVAAKGSEAMKKIVDNQLKWLHYRAVIMKSAAEEGSAHLTEKTKKNLMDVVNINADEKLSDEQKQKKISAIESNPDAVAELKRSNFDKRIFDFQSYGKKFFELDKDNDGFVSLEELNSEQAKKADINGDGKLSPYEYVRMG